MQNPTLNEIKTQGSLSNTYSLYPEYLLHTDPMLRARHVWTIH